MTDAIQRAPAAEAEEFPAPDGFTPGFRDVDGVRLHYVRGGAGPLALLVHGFAQTWYEWHRLIRCWRRARRWSRSTCRAWAGRGRPRPSYAGQDVAAILHGFARSFSPDVPFDLVAHDIGIWNTYPMLAEHPADVRRAVLMKAPIPDGDIYTYPAFTPRGEALVWHFSFFAARRLPMPLLAIGGGGHGGFGEAEAAQIRRYANDVTGHSLPGCGHWVPEEAPDQMNSLVVAFLRPD